MNVASKQLCEELYKLSGWEYSIDFWWVLDSKQYSPPEWVLRGFALGESYPAYDLAYLIRKLPSTDKIGDHWSLWHNTDGSWGIDFDDYGFDAVTPEEAACMLAIELFKNGILTPELSSKEKER